MKIKRDFALRLLDEAKRGGADYAEVYIKTSRNLTVEVKNQKVDALESSVDFGYSIRVIRDLRLGFSFSTDIRESGSVVGNALEASKWTEQDNHLGMPLSYEDSEVKIFDPLIATLKEEDAVNSAVHIEKAALDSDKRIKKTRKASASFSEKNVHILNSRGIDKTYPSTECSAQITVVAEDNADSQMGWDFDGSRFLGDINFGDVGRKASARALQMLGARKTSATKAHVILDNAVATEFLSIFASLLSSEAVQKGKSLLSGRLNQQVVSPLMNIIDDGCLPHRLGSRPFDDEGVPTFRKNLIKDGELLGYMYNVYTASKDGARSTGNAVRGGFSSLPSVGPSNMFIDAGDRPVKQDELISVLDRGLCITEAMGVHMANPVSGEFSIGVSGLWIENGSVKFPVKEAVVSGNILDFFSKVVALGDDLRFYGNMASPSIVVGPVDISA